MYRHTVFVLFLIINPIFCEKSFTIVLDTTESMKDEINIIKANIGNVVNNVNVSKSHSNYILVPFGDTVIELHISETARSFTRDINSINPTGGLDCPENSLSGIESGLRSSKEESNIFVFTDAYSKDFNNFLSVRDLCIQTHSQVTIFLSGFCLPSESRIIGNSDVYYDVAKACSGTFIQFDTASEIRQAFNFMREISSVDWTDISVSEKFMGHQIFTHNIDQFTTDFMIAITGTYASVDIYLSNQPQDFQKILVTRHSLVIRIQPTSGDYTINVRANGVITATFYTKHNIPFKIGFSSKRPRSLWETSDRPIAARTNYILISISTSIRLDELEFLEYEDNAKKILYLEEIKPGIYICSTFINPDKPFKIWVKGQDKITMQHIIVPTKYISPQVAVPNTKWSDPKAEIQSLESNIIDYGANVTLVCKVYGFPKPNIVWEEDGNVLSSEDVLLVIPNIHLSYMNLTNVSKNTTIFCKGENARGSYVHSIDIFVIRPYSFDVITIPEDSTVQFEDEIKVQCQVNAYPEASISWLKDDIELSYASNIEINQDENALTISKFGIDDAGSYSCVANNGVETKRFDFDLQITGVEAPKVHIDETEIILKPGDSKEIECSTTGKPDPTLKWEYKSHNSEYYTSLPNEIEENGFVIKINSASKYHEGSYRCTSTNAMGTDSQDVLVKIQYAPIIKDSETKSINVREENEIKLSCEVDSIPEAVVRWEMSQDDVMIHDDRHRTIRMHNIYILQFTAHYNDSGYYHCIAENNIGRAEKTVFVNVLVAPYIDGPKSNTIVAAKGSNMELPCTVSYGNPAPSTKWEFTGIQQPPKVLQRGNSTNPLYLTNISSNHEGNYSCIAENQINTDRIKYHLKLQ